MRCKQKINSSFYFYPTLRTSQFSNFQIWSYFVILEIVRYFQLEKFKLFDVDVRTIQNLDHLKFLSTNFSNVISKILDKIYYFFLFFNLVKYNTILTIQKKGTNYLLDFFYERKQLMPLTFSRKRRKEETPIPHDSSRRLRYLLYIFFPSENRQINARSIFRAVWQYSWNEDTGIFVKSFEENELRRHFRRRRRRARARVL